MKPAEESAGKGTVELDHDAASVELRGFEPLTP
jgi:hypothetical protein